MPKKITSGTDKGRYKVDFRPAGAEGKRCRGIFNTMAEGNAYKRHCITKYGNVKEWQESKPDQRDLKTLISTWHRLHGKSLKRGTERKRYLLNLCEIMGNPIASRITAASFSAFREQRLESVGSNTANHDLAYFKALFNELAQLGEWKADNPIASVRRLKVPKTKLAYLSEPEQDALLAELDKSDSSHARISARICLATGARWSEAATLRKKQLKDGLVTFTDTKNGKNRTLPLDPALFALARRHAPLTDGYNTLKRAIAKLDLDLPRGQLSHVLRHTFATYFLRNGGRLEDLQEILDHEDIKTTMRYVHLSPRWADNVLRFNPLNRQSTTDNKIATCPHCDHILPSNDATDRHTPPLTH